MKKEIEKLIDYAVKTDCLSEKEARYMTDKQKEEYIDKCQDYADNLRNEE